MRICAVVVTFNRRAWLLECLDTLLAQTQALSGIVVINNASTDDTQIELDHYVAAHPKMTWHITHSSVNTGGAGGFAQGMQTAHAAGYDWVWVMDDDVLARPEALSGLMKFSNQAQILHGRRTNPNGTVFYWQNTFLPWIGFARPYPDSIFKTADIWYTNCACFEGALIHRSVFDKIGYADTRYFLAWDDTEFGYRASEFFKIAYVNAMTLVRQRGHDNIDIGVRSLYRASDMYRYFHIRNRFLIIQTILQREPRAWARAGKRITFHAFTAVLVVKEMVRAAMFKEWSLGVPSLWRGLRDGVAGKWGAQS